MKPVWYIFLAACLALSSCKSIEPAPFQATGTALAKVQASAAHTGKELRMAQKSSGGRREAHIDSAIVSNDTTMVEANNADDSRMADGKKYWRLYGDYNSWPAKYMGWKNWEHIKLLLAIYAGIGVLGLVLHATGIPRLATIVFGIIDWIPGPNVFKAVANRIDASRAAPATVILPTDTAAVAVVPAKKKAKR